MTPAGRVYRQVNTVALLYTRRSLRGGRSHLRISAVAAASRLSAGVTDEGRNKYKWDIFPVFPAAELLNFYQAARRRVRASIFNGAGARRIRRSLRSTVVSLSDVVGAGCGRSIEDRVVFSVNGLLWHGDCLQCCQCRQPLTDKCFCRDNKFYCRTDYLRSAVRSTFSFHRSLPQ